MRHSKKGIALGAALCVLALVFSVWLQKAGYLIYLNSDMASEVILANRQAQTHSLIQMDWLYSTEIHSIHMNLFYALAFLLTPSYEAVRIIGNTFVFVLGMAACAGLCSACGLSLGAALCVSAMLPLAASAVYASNMTIGGYYIIHLIFGFWGVSLWLRAARRQRKRDKAAFALLCLVEGLCSVRYVLCFLCPMVAVAGLDWLLSAGKRTRRDAHTRFLTVTLAGFAMGALGYAASEILYPRLFASGVGGAGSFVFNPLDGPAMGQTLWTVFADFLKLIGWRGGVALFSPEGAANLMIAAVLLLGAISARRAYAGLNPEDERGWMGRRVMQYAAAAFGVNLFCFVFVQGTYLNRYLILAVIFFVPALGVTLHGLESGRLRRLLLLAVCGQLALSAGLMLRDTRAAAPEAEARGADMMEAADYLTEIGYMHGYGTFWNVRVMQERTQGALTFTAVAPVETEEGAVSSVSLDPIRWLEPAAYSRLDICKGRTFLLLTREEETQLAPWLAMTGAPKLHENDTFAIYGFASSMRLCGDMMLGKMKLENAAFEDGAYTLYPGGRMRVPTSWREKGNYILKLSCEGEGGTVQAFATHSFERIGEAALVPGENSVRFTLKDDDKYFMLLIKSAENEIRLTNLELLKEQ